MMLKACCALALLVVVACVRVANGPPAPLLNGFRSFESTTAVRQQLGNAWIVLEENSREAPAGAAEFRKLIAEVPEYTGVPNCSGRLLLQFHNDRLMETVLYPRQMEVCMRSLVSNGFRSTTTKATAEPVILMAPNPNPNVRVFTAADVHRQQYISFIDIRLEREYLDWIRAYS